MWACTVKYVLEQVAVIIGELDTWERVVRLPNRRGDRQVLDTTGFRVGHERCVVGELGIGRHANELGKDLRWIWPHGNQADPPHIVDRMSGPVGEGDRPAGHSARGFTWDCADLDSSGPTRHPCAFVGHAVLLFSLLLCSGPQKLPQRHVRHRRSSRSAEPTYPGTEGSELDLPVFQPAYRREG